MRLVALGLVTFLVSCGDSPTESAGLELGTSDFHLSGALLVRGQRIEYPSHFQGTACERLGWINLYSVPPIAVAVYRSGVDGFAVGEVQMQPDPDIDPGGHMNGFPLGTMDAVGGTTTFTLVTDDEIQGRLDWTLAYPDNPEVGTLHLEGSFRSLRTGDECMPSATGSVTGSGG